MRILDILEHFSSICMNETAMQNILSIKKTLCDETCLLGGHVVNESEECWHIWDTACRESVNFRGSGDEGLNRYLRLFKSFKPIKIELKNTRSFQEN
jgi:hypothetical protein